jgi:hypothetical protein
MSLSRAGLTPMGRLLCFLSESVDRLKPLRNTGKLRFVVLLLLAIRFQLFPDNSWPWKPLASFGKPKDESASLSAEAPFWLSRRFSLKDVCNLISNSYKANLLLQIKSRFLRLCRILLGRLGRWRLFTAAGPDFLVPATNFIVICMLVTILLGGFRVLDDQTIPHFQSLPP